MLCTLSWAAPGVTEEPVRLGEYLTIVAMRYDCYFTIELASPADTHTEFQFHANVPRGIGRDNTVEDCVALLRREFPKYEIFRDPRNGAVFHIIDKDLKKTDDYCLDRAAAACYNGKLYSFPNYLGSQVRDLSGWTNHCIGLPIYDDFTTQMNIDTRGQKDRVRSLLTDYMPLSRYSRLLWCAETHPGRGGSVTDIHYSGGETDEIEFSTYTYNEQRATLYDPHPIRRADVDCRTGTPMVDGVIPFTFGQIAYCNNPDPDKVKLRVNLDKLAAIFIDERLRADNPLQVRWAMLYLGKRKAESGIPVLLEHLDYRYTTCGVLEESYPAVRALTMIGKPAGDAALKELLDEDESDLRVRLLTAVVRAVNGYHPTHDMVEKALAAPKDDKQKKRLEQALKLLREEE